MKTGKKEDRYIFIALAVIAVLFAVTRLFLLTKVPRGLNVDEAGMAYDAFCLANYGTDRYLTRFPVYLTNYGSGQSALYAYLAAFFIKLIGFRPTAFRLPAVCAGGIAVICGYLIGKETMGKKAGVVLAGLITICPYFIMASRWGLDCNLMMGFFALSVWLLMLAVRREKTGWFVLAGACFGLTLYTYAVSYVMIPLFLLFSFLYLLWTKKLSVRKAVAFVIPLFLMALPLILFIAVNTGYLEPVYTPFFTIERLEYYRGGEFALANIPANKRIFIELLSTDFLPYNSFGKFGTLYYISIPFILIGIVLSLVRTVKSIWHREYDSQTFITIMFWTMVPVILVMMLPNINKANAIYFPFIYFAALAFDFIFRKIPQRRKRARVSAACVAGSVYLVFFIWFSGYYYFQYPTDVYPQKYFNDSLIQMIDLIEEEYPDGKERYIYVDTSDDNVSQPYIYTLIRSPLSPSEWMEQRGRENSYGHYCFYMPDEVDENGIYIMYSNEEVTEELIRTGFTAQEFECWEIYSK